MLHRFQLMVSQRQADTADIRHDIAIATWNLFKSVEHQTCDLLRGAWSILSLHDLTIRNVLR